VADESLTCPSCASTHPLSERFCPDCGMPLVHSGSAGVEGPVTEARERARKVKPQYAEGDLVRVAGGRNQSEAEMIQGMLLEEGIPSLLRRTRGFDVPDFMAAGPRDVLVPERGAEVARQVLLQAELVADAPQGAPGASPWVVLAALVGGVAVLALLVWAVSTWGG
jgi:hypothetical protein